MRIFTKKSFKFRAGGKTVTTNALSFANVPEWVTEDPIFALAVEEGSIEIVNGKADEKLIETTGTKKPEQEIPKVPLTDTPKEPSTGSEADGNESGSGEPGQSGDTSPGDTGQPGNTPSDEQENPAGNDDTGNKKKAK